MTRPRHGTIEITAETQMERLRERFSRRELIQLLGAGGAAAIAGCGGGGQDTATPTGTATEAPGQETPADTPTPTDADGETPADTPTPTDADEDTPTDTPTPSDEYEVTDVMLRRVTTQNFEKLNPNQWNSETGGLPIYQRLKLAEMPFDAVARETTEASMATLFPMALQGIEMDPQDNVLTFNLREDLTWSDGSPCDAENLMMHADILYAQIELAQGGVGGGGGEIGETSMPLSMEIEDSHTVVGQLAPGNPVLRMLEPFSGGVLSQIGNTHPEIHRKFVERIRDATTRSEIQTALQKLTTATFSPDRLPDMALSPFVPTEWDPSEITFEARTDWPWGLDYNPDMSRIFKGLRLVSISEQTNAINAAVAGKNDWTSIGTRPQMERFGDNWEFVQLIEADTAALYFGKKSKWAKKTEKSRMMRQAVAYLFDNQKLAAINDIIPTYEASTGFGLEKLFKEWIGNDFFMENFTNYGHKETGYAFPEKAARTFREAGFQKNKNGVWVDAGSGEPLAPTALLSIAGGTWGYTRPAVNNIVEQLNDNGIKATGKIREGEAYQNRVQEHDFDMALMTSQAEVLPHPYFGLREDLGLGSPDLPSTIASWDYRNGYKRVQVPVPLGNPDGDLATVNWDQSVLELLQIRDQEKMKNEVRFLAWVLNQWVPGVFLTVFRRWFAVNGNKMRLNDPKPFRFYHSNHAAGFYQPR